MNIHLLYPGGCGGHICSHLILQSGEHTCVLNSTDDDHELWTDVGFEQAKAQQWDIVNAEQWKNKEFWPQNNQTLKLDASQQKFYLSCNPGGNHELLVKYPATSVFLYLDLSTHWEMMKYKHANWFYDTC